MPRRRFQHDSWPGARLVPVGLGGSACPITGVPIKHRAVVCQPASRDFSRTQPHRYPWPRNPLSSAADRPHPLGTEDAGSGDAVSRLPRFSDALPVRRPTGRWDSANSPDRPVGEIRIICRLAVPLPFSVLFGCFGVPRVYRSNLYRPVNGCPAAFSGRSRAMRMPSFALLSRVRHGVDRLLLSGAFGPWGPAGSAAGSPTWWHATRTPPYVRGSGTSTAHPAVAIGQRG